MRFALLLFVSVASAQMNSRISASSSVHVGTGSTSVTGAVTVTALNTHATLAYTAPSGAACTVEVSTSPLYTPPVIDIDTTLWGAGANSDARDPLLVNGTTRAFVVGRRTVETALDSNNYSRALQTDTLYYYRVCGVYTGTFSTTTMPVNVSRNDLPTLTSASYYWTEPTLNGTRNQQIIDPQTGVLYARQTLLSDVVGSPNNGLIQGFGGLSRPHTNQMFTSGDGQQGYVSCYWDSNGGGGMYFFIPATGETRFIGQTGGIIHPVMADDKTFLQFRGDLSPTGLYQIPYTGTFMSGDFATGTPILNQANSSGGPCVALTVLDPMRFPTPFSDYECALTPTYANQYTSFFFQNTGYPAQDSPGVEGVMWGGDGRPYDSTCSAGPTLCPHAVAAFIIGSAANPNGCTNHNNEMQSTDLVKLNLKSNDGSCVGGYASVVFWPFLTDPDGSSIAQGPWGFGGHDDFKGPGPFSPNGTGGGNPNGPIARIEEASSYCPGGSNGCAYDAVIGNPQSGTTTTTPTTAIGSDNPFAGTVGSGRFGLVRHPNWEGDPLQSSANNASTFWDDVPYGGGGYPSDLVAASVTLVGGKSRTYKFVGVASLHRKQQDTVAASADGMYQDISSPSTNTLCDTGSCGGQYCVANAANECITGAVAGDIYFNPAIDPPTVLGCAGSEVPNTGTPDICIMDSSLHMINIGQFWGLGGVDASNKSRMIGHGLAKSVRFTSSFPTAKPYPDTSWVTFQTGLFLSVSTSDIWAAKIPMYPAVPDGKDRTTFLRASIPVTTPTGMGISTATVEFGYLDYGTAAQHYCTTRREACAVGASSVTDATPFQFVTTDTPVRLSCATSCTPVLPVLPLHTAYFTVKFYDAGGTYVADGPSGVAVEDVVVSVGTI